MAAPQSVTLRGRWLGQQLRELRDANKMLLNGVADYLQRDKSTVSRFESGVYPIRRPDLLALLDLYGVADPKRREQLMTLSQEVWQRDWWDGYAGDVAGSLIDHVWLESRARELYEFENTVVPGLLQTKPYACAAITAADFDAGVEQRERWLELRMERQSILADDDPPRVSVIVDEAVLRRRVGGADVQVEQLRWLVELGARPGFDLRVLPFSAGAHASPTGAFKIFTMEKPFPQVAYADTPKGAIYVESPDSDRFARMYDELRSLALESDESAELISAMAEELR